MQILIYFIAIAGILAHLLAKWRDAMTKNEPMNWKEHLLWAAYSTIFVCAIILGYPQIKEWLNLTLEMTYFVAFLIGYASDSVIKNVLSFNPFQTE